jgi:hypothetical protein
VQPNSRELNDQQGREVAQLIAQRDLVAVHDAFRQIVMTQHGRKVFAAIMQMFPFDESPFAPNSNQMCYTMGQQSVSMWIKKELFVNADCEEYYEQMRKETKAWNAMLLAEKEKSIEILRKGGKLNG